MAQYWILWIFIYGLLLQSHHTTASADTTPTDSSILNLVIENSTNGNFDKQSKTTVHNSSDSLSLNNVNSDSVHSTSTNEECKSDDCVKNAYTSSSTDNSSTASKILWNLVSTIKSTTVQPSMSDEGSLNEARTFSSLNIPINTHSSNHSSLHNTSFYSSDNELDSDISYDNNVLDVYPVHSAEVMNNLFPKHDNINLTTASTEDSIMTTEVLINELNDNAENSTFIGEATELHSQAILYDHNVSDVSNISEYTTTPNIQDTTIYADDELDFTTYFSDVSGSFDANTMKEVDTDMHTHPQFSENSTTELSGTQSSELSFSSSADYNESSTLFSLNYDRVRSTESEDLKSKDTESVTVTNPESYTSSSSDTDVLIFENIENSTLAYVDYDTSDIENEELKTSDAHITNVVNIKNTTHTSLATSDISERKWTYEEMLKTTLTSSNIGISTSTETSINDFETTPALATSEKQDASENMELNKNKSSENTDSNSSMTSGKILWTDRIANDSTEFTEEIDYIVNSSQEVTESTSIHHIPNYTSISDPSSEQPVLSINLTATTAYPESADELNFSVTPDRENASSALQKFSDDSTENSLNSTYSHDSSTAKASKQNASVFASNMENEFEDERKTSTNSYDESSVTANTDPNINVVYLHTVPDISTPSSYYSNSLNEIHNNLSSVQSSHSTIPSDSRFVETSTIILETTNTPATASSIKENSFGQKLSTIQMLETSSETNSETEATTTVQTVNTVLTSTENLKNETSLNSLDVSLSASDKKTKSDHITEENFNQRNSTDHSSEVSSEKMNTLSVNSAETFSSSSTTVSVLAVDSNSVITENTIMYHSENIKPSVTEYNFHESSYTIKEKSTVSEKESVAEVSTDNGAVSDTSQFHTTSLSSTDEIEITTLSASSEVPSLSITETHREGKHIPFSSTLVRSTTQYPRIFNATLRTYSHPPQAETTENQFVNLLYNQIKAEDLSPEEKSNVINAVVKLSDKYYSKDELKDRIAIIHLWLLHAIADEYKNATLNLSGSNSGQLDEIEFENLPQILYVLPTPEVFLPNISFTFVVHNKWRNETFPVDIILTILNLHTENLKHLLVDIEEIHFSHGLLVQKHDLLSLLVEKYGIILLSTCLITVGMILLLICVVIYYRRKTRHSAHCLTDDKLHRNMQEAMGIDLNPAVIILQDEIREKAALNGNKICSLDDDEGWLAPIGDVPVEDNNAPFVQDTKL